MQEADVLIIGAGVVGLAVAAELSKRYKEIIVLEKHSNFGQETSSRNSEVIHAGIYYPKDSLKAKMCVEGRKKIYAICRKNDIPCKKIGKLIVAGEKEEIPALEELFKNGKGNGVEDLQLMGADDLKRMEPNVSGVAALYSPSTGIIDSHKLMRYFLDVARKGGTAVCYNSEAVNIIKHVTGYRVMVRNNEEIIPLNVKAVINSAGLDSDRIAEMAGLDVERLSYRLHYCKGQYFRANHSKSRLIKRLIYPVPRPKSAGLGVHATLDLSGSMRLGPDEEYLNNRDKDYTVDGSRKDNFSRAASRLLPFMDGADLCADTAGIRPKLQSEGGDFRDFLIREETTNGLAGFINLVGIESPGLTASPAIAEFVSSMVNSLG